MACSFLVSPKQSTVMHLLTISTVILPQPHPVLPICWCTFLCWCIFLSSGASEEKRNLNSSSRLCVSSERFCKSQNHYANDFAGASPSRERMGKLLLLDKTGSSMCDCPQIHSLHCLSITFSFPSSPILSPSHSILPSPHSSFFYVLL